MSIIVYADLHYGKNLPKIGANGAALWGMQAMHLHNAMQFYAKDKGITSMVDIGDRSNWKDEQSARAIADFTKAAQQTIYTNIGNHDPYHLAAELGFDLTTQTIDLDAFQSTRLINCQVSRVESAAGLHIPHYGYDAAAINKASRFDDPSIKNRLYFGHWAFDRFKRGYPNFQNKQDEYAYIDNMQGLFTRLSALPSNHSLSVHGHEHQFSMTGCGRHTSLVLPSIAQEDAEDPSQPCGLFAVISEDAKGKLAVEFKKISLLPPPTSDNVVAITRTVDLNYMKRYSRPTTLAA